jgi:hypothetical protein
MRTIMVLSALSLAIAAVVTVPAQSPASTVPLTQTASLLSFPTAWTAAALSRPVSPAAESLPEAPMPAAEFAAILSVPCITRTAPDGGPTPTPDSADVTGRPCLQSPNPYARFLDTTMPVPLTPAQKARLAIHDLKDPGNLVTIADLAAFTIATNSHTAYGPGWGGFVRDAGYSFSQDATGEFFGTFLIPSIAHQDPRYHRMPNASVPRRILHALSHTLIAQSDTGVRMPNFSTLLTYPISAEISNLYVPGINDNGPSTVERILTGYATDPADNLVAEFLPDVARRIHIRVVFVQSILNQVSSGQVGMAPSVVQ